MVGEDCIGILFSVCHDDGCLCTGQTRSGPPAPLFAGPVLLAHGCNYQADPRHEQYHHRNSKALFYRVHKVRPLASSSGM